MTPLALTCFIIAIGFFVLAAFQFVGSRRERRRAELAWKANQAGSAGEEFNEVTGVENVST
jgi:hypothetical protein